MLLDRRTFFVKERVGILKLEDRYDIFDPESGEQVGFAQELISTWNKVVRFLLPNWKTLFPTTVVVKEDEESDPVLTIQRGFSLFIPNVEVIDRHQMSVGFFKAKFFSLSGGFTVHVPTGEQIADVKGNWKGWDFKLNDMDGNELGTVNKQWAGAMKEFFTSADHYVISLSDEVGENPGLAALLLAAGLAIDIVFKEQN